MTYPQLTDMSDKLWEVRSTNVTVLKTYVKAPTREEAKKRAMDNQWQEVSATAKLTANQSWSC